MAKSTKSKAGSKPAKHPKPHPDFPLFPHDTGRWAKKVRQKLHYFGKIEGDEDGQAALAKWLEQKDELLAGRTPRVKGDGLSVVDLCERYLTNRKSLCDAGEIATRTFDRYYKTCEYLVSALGKSRLVDDLRPEDFQSLRASMTKRWGPVALGNEIQMIRTVFRFGYENGLTDKPVRFGSMFDKPSAKVIRATRAASGPQMFTPDEIRQLLDHATVNMRAMILLGVNAALGNTDLAMLPITAVDLAGGWLNYPRVKTAIPRRIPLWPETVAAIKAVLAARRDPKDSADTGLLFISPRGISYVGNNRGYRVHGEFLPVTKRAKVEGRSFYDLRRTFQTIGENAHDLVAVQAIMGHAAASGDMSAVYRQRVDDDRLQAVTDHVRGWLFVTPAPAAGDAGQSPAADGLRDE